MTSSKTQHLDDASDAAWRFLTRDMEPKEADGFLDELESSSELVAALEQSAEDFLSLRCLADEDLRSALAGAEAEGADLDALMDLEHDPDALLEAAIAAGRARQTAWNRFRGFARRSRAGLVAVAAAAAVVLFTVGQPAPFVPDYDGGWTNGAAQTRSTTGIPGRYVVTNTAELVLRPLETHAGDDLEVRAFVGRSGGPLRPLEARSQQGQTGAVRVLIDVTPELGVGTHRVVILLGPALDGADPEQDTDRWARFETTMEVVEGL